jgi:Ca-activated chloride channel homolog
MAGLALARFENARATRSLRAVLATIFFSFLCAAAGFPQVQQSQPAIHVHVDQVNVDVIVTDAIGHFAENLHRENFHVFDNGVEQPIAGFSSIEGPAQVLLLVESGPAVYLLEGAHISAVSTLLKGLAPDDRVALAAYAESPQLVLDFTTDKQVAVANLDRLRFNLGSTNLNLSSSLAAVLNSLDSSHEKKTIVLLSTGVDTSSTETIAALIARLKVSDVRVFSLSLSGSLRATPPRPRHKKKGPEPAPPDPMFAEADQELRSIAEFTGGRSYFPRTSAEFTGACDEIAQLIRHEYSLSFAAPVHDAAIHSLEVRVSMAASSPAIPPPVYRVSHRSAYLAPE